MHKVILFTSCIYCQDKQKNSKSTELHMHLFYVCNSNISVFMISFVFMESLKTHNMAVEYMGVNSHPFKMLDKEPHVTLSDVMPSWTDEKCLHVDALKMKKLHRFM